MSIFSIGKEEQSIPEEPRDLEAILARISAGASGRDEHPSFPEDPFARLAPTGVLAIPVPDPIGRQGRRASFAEEWRVLRAVAGSDGSVGRILDGHFNGVERVSLLAPEPLRSREMEAIAAGTLLLGVWGADPIPGEESRLGWCKKRGSKALRCQDFLFGCDGPGSRARACPWPGQGTARPCLRRPCRRRSRYNVVQGRRHAGLGEPPRRFRRDAGARRPGRTGRAPQGTILQQGRNPNGSYVGRDLRHGRRRRARRAGRQSRGWRTR